MKQNTPEKKHLIVLIALFYFESMILMGYLKQCDFSFYDNDS